MAELQEQQKITQQQAQQQNQQKNWGAVDTPAQSLQDVERENELGLRAFTERRLETAAAHFQKAIAADTTAYFAHANLAAVYQLQGKHNDAVEDFNFAMGLAPDCALSLYGGGDSLIVSGFPERAWDYYSAASRAMRGYPPREPPTKENLVPCAICDQISATLDMATTYKLRHDSAQIQYLILRGILPQSFSKLADMHDNALQQISALPTASYGVNISSLTGPDYNRMYHVRIPSAVVGDALNKNLVPSVSSNTHEVYDSVLSDEALGEVLAFCRESHVFHKARDGYILGDENGGYGSDALLRIAEELQTSMSSVIGTHKLIHMMGRKYEENWNGNDLRCEDAAVTILLWVTPDVANLDKSSGGLTVYQESPPCRGNCEQAFNSISGQTELFTRKASSPSQVPYKANRAIVLKGNIAYASQQSRFSNHFENQRLMLSFLFGSA